MKNALKVKGEKRQAQGRHKTLLIFILGFVLVGLSFHYSSAQPSLETATNFILKDPTGREHALNDFRGKIVVLIYGELSQENTLKSIQDLKEIITEKQSYRESVEVLLIVSERMKPEKYAEITRELEISCLILRDDQRMIYAQYDIIVFPTTFVIDRSGKITATFPSHTIYYYDQLDAEIGYLLNEVKEEEELKRVLNPKSSQNSKNDKTERILSLAENLRRRCFYDRSLHSYKKVLEKNPTIIEAYLGIGIIYLEKIKEQS